MSDRPTVDLPEPDSPTSPTISRLAMWNAMESTARSGPARVANSTVRPLTSSRGEPLPTLMRDRQDVRRGRGLGHGLDPICASDRVVSGRRRDYSRVADPEFDQTVRSNAYCWVQSVGQPLKLSVF